MKQYLIKIYDVNTPNVIGYYNADIHQELVSRELASRLSYNNAVGVLIQFNILRYGGVTYNAELEEVI